MASSWPDWLVDLALVPISVDAEACRRAFLAALVERGPANHAWIRSQDGVTAEPAGVPTPAEAQLRFPLSDGEVAVCLTRSLEPGEQAALQTLCARLDVALVGAAAGVRVKQLEADSRAREQFHESIVENLPNMIFVKEAKDLRFVRMNRAGEALVGVTRDELIGRNDYDLFPADEADFFTAKDREVLAGKQMLDIPEEPIHTRHLGTRYLHTKKIPLYSEDGQPEYLVGISEDVTAVREAREALSALRGELEVRVKLRTGELELANGELEAFVRSVSHDLRTPVRSIHGCGELLLEERGAALGVDGQMLVGQILDGCRRLTALFDALQALSRISRAALDPQRVSLTEVALRLGAEIRKHHQHPVELKVEPGLMVNADPQLVEILVENLLDNAFKFTRDAEVARVEVSAHGATTFCIKDNGVGFEPRYAEQLLQPFRRLHAALGFSGTGIGLATAARIVQRHGGMLWAEGAVGEGATFTLMLPEGPAA